MAAGLVVLASDVCGSALDRIEHGVNGFLHASGDANELSRQLCALICRIVEQRSHFFGKSGVDPEAKSHALKSLGIKEREFNQFLNER